MSVWKAKYHYIYKVTYLPNGKYYVGMHSTDNLEDGYMGSGRRIKWLVKRYGLEHFKFEILEYLPNRKSLIEREKEIVGKELLKDIKCLNLKEGGEGGFSSWSVAKRKVSLANKKKQVLRREQQEALKKLFNRKKSW